MKKRKCYKLTVWLLLVSLFGNISVQAKTIERANVAFHDMKYKKIEKQQVDTLMQEGYKIAQSGNVNQLVEWERMYMNMLDSISANAQLAYLYYELDTTDDYFYNEYIYCVQLIGDMQSAYVALYEDEKYNTLSQDMQQYYKLRSKREALEEKYTNLQHTMVIKLNGKDVTLVEISQDQSLSRDKKIEIVNGEWYDAYNKAAGEILLQLVAIDNQIAKIVGYNTAAEYMYKCYDRDYIPNDSTTFWNGIKTYVPKVYSKLDKLAYEGLNDLKAYSYENEEAIVEAVESNFIAQYASLQESYNYLVKYDLYDITPSSKKVSGGLTAYLDAYNEPFILLNYTKDYQILSSLIHEFGHFHYEYVTGNVPVSLDLGEVYSQALEFLAMPYHEEMLGSKGLGDNLNVIVLSDILRAVIDGCIYDEFLQTVYANPNMTVDELNNLYEKIAGEYGLEVDKREWVEVEHNYEVPFYYSSYSVSAIIALEIWEQSLQDHDGAMSTYMKLIQTGAEYEFTEAIKQAGLENPFSEQVVKELMDAIEKHYKLNEIQINTANVA